MNYNLQINQVDLAAFLVSLGYELEDYTIFTKVEIVNNDFVKERNKSASFRFSDKSAMFESLGSSTDVIKKYKLPEKWQEIKNVAELAKLTAHNYQVLKSVITENKPLQQIKSNGYTMLKNDNADEIPNEINNDDERTTDLMAVAISCSLGGVITAYEMKNGLLTISMNERYLSEIERDYCKDDENDFSDRAVLIATAKNRKTLMSGIYSNEKIILKRGGKYAIFNKDITPEQKKEIIERLNN